MSVGRPASSDSEIAASVILDHNYKKNPQGQTGPVQGENALFELVPDVATNLLMGIEDASNGFTTNSNADTFMIVSQLMRAGGTRQPKQAVSPGSFPQGSIPSQPYNVIPNQNQQTKQEEEPPLPEEPYEPSSSEQSPPEDWMKPAKVYKGSGN